MPAVLAGSELDTQCQILTTSPAIDQRRLPGPLAGLQAGVSDVVLIAGIASNLIPSTHKIGRNRGWALRRRRGCTQRRRGRSCHSQHRVQRLGHDRRDGPRGITEPSHSPIV